MPFLFCSEQKIPLAVQRDLRGEIQRLHSRQDSTTFFSQSLAAMVRLTRGMRAFVATFERKTRSFRVEAELEFGDERGQRQVDTLLGSVARYVIHRKNTFFVGSVARDRRLHEFPELADFDAGTLLCAPLFRGKKVVGVVYLDRKREGTPFRETDRAVLEIFCQHLGWAQENLELQVQVEEAHSGFIEALFQMERLHRVLGRAFLTPEVFAQSRSEWKGKGMIFGKGFPGFGGSSRQTRNLLKVLERVAQSDSTAYIFGESGTGKELVARAIHAHGKRAKGPFLSVNCGAIPGALLESELFGHEKGAFTSAHTQRAGLFELANGGTLFLDEVGEMSAEMQVKLLRVLQEREVRRIGGTQTLAVDVRVISASNASIQEMVSRGTFRQDLFFRLNVIMITLPPLRERIEDLEFIAQEMLSELAREREEPPKTLTRGALNLLERYPWPGNMRELRNTLERCVTFVKGAVIEDLDLPREIFEERTAGENKERFIFDPHWFELPYEEAISACERKIIEETLVTCKGNVLLCAEILEMQRSSLRRKIEQYAIDPKRFKQYKPVTREVSP